MSSSDQMPTVRTGCAVVVLVASCAGAKPPPPQAEPRPRPACPDLALPTPGRDTVYGVVTDASGRPLEGVHVSVLGWAYWHGNWKPGVNARTTTGRNGAYSIVAWDSNAAIEYELDGRKVRGARPGILPRRIDVVLDVTRPRGLIGVFDAKAIPTDRCEKWVCPQDRTPADAWWTLEDPCPANTHLAYRAFLNLPGFGVACVTADEVPHGPATEWTPIGEHEGWRVSSRWFDQGKPCGPSREDPPPRDFVQPEEPDRPPYDYAYPPHGIHDPVFEPEVAPPDPPKKR